MAKLPIKIKDMTRDQLRAYHREKQKGYRQGGVKNMPRSAEFKYCITCEKEFPRSIDYFYRSASGYYSSRCKTCSSLRRKEYRLLYEGRYKDKYKGRYKKKWARMGLNAERYNKLFVGASCAICNEDERQKLVLDHCHIRNKIRSVLCNSCNSMLGFANDEPWILEEGAAYLRRHGGT